MCEGAKRRCLLRHLFNNGRYLTNAIQLPNLVADEGHKLYLDFITHDQNRLQEYLGFVRLAHLAALEQKADPFALAAL